MQYINIEAIVPFTLLGQNRAAKIIIELDVNLLTVFFPNVNGVIGVCRGKKNSTHFRRNRLLESVSKKATNLLR
jgi:hypothetical protein